MTFYYSMKQMFRSPLKSFLFFLLIGVSAFFLALGGNLLFMSKASLEEFEKSFTTIGTVEQTKKDLGMIKWQNPFTKQYEYIKDFKYGDRIREDVLDFEGANYIIKPRQRPYFAAYVEDMYQGLGGRLDIQVEATPLEAPTGQPTKMQITKVWEGSVEEGEVIYITDRSNQDEEPLPFEMGKTYVMRLTGWDIYQEPGTEGDNNEGQINEYYIQSGITSSQYTLDGEPVDDPITDALDKEYDEVGDIAFTDEVTEGFYDTEKGKRWIEAAGQQDHMSRLVLVQPTEGTELLMPFYRDEVVIKEGRDITEEEYKNKEKVCLIPDMLAIQLRKSVGDQVNLPLYAADYKGTPVDSQYGLGFSLLNAEGKMYPVFNEQEYKIVGIYKVVDEGEGSYGMGKKVVVIPWGAVPENSWKDNIGSFGRMSGANTSFQIPNGTIQKYQELLEKQGIKDLKITLYDKGYTQLKDGIENRKLMSWIFLVSGCVMAVMILLFFSNVFITGQQKRIAVERILGRTKKQCAGSILTGLLLLAALGSIAGSIAGWKATGVAAKKADTELVFDLSFSNAATGGEEKKDVKWTKPSVEVALGAGGALIAAAVLISSCYMGANLKKEPLELLGRIEE
ncbi:FtsX-like permease family protein [Faecalicatena sp. AGMB00832]|uniref:FtsX-like permease family protein n=1 Tax=Faecalicatena faecalis TaxID=2726362 RepID=A0ABS6D037_9FIRM|nr:MULTISPECIES: FtsX-like permease family protein [Faecalicatena]MBU3874940.1 FtsX-like permease family protein [Faecalicatena faecalis]MCI6465655.1 FtsX-like permease family protein [Faecalicatena sp.]MDY5618070.1 FtsX-like permease family protein [Lachnospiraceae bacterium]